MKKNRWMIFAEHGLINLSEPPADPGGDPTPKPTPPANPPADPGPPRTFVQEEVNAIATREHERGAREAKKQAEEALLKTLGVESMDQVADLAALAAAAKAADDANKTQAQKDAEAAAKARAEAEADRATAAAERQATRLERTLSAAGMDEATQEFITVPGLTVDSTPEDIKAAVDKMKADQPNLFTGKVSVPDGDPNPPGRRRPATGQFGGEGAKRFENQVKRETPQVFSQ